MSDTDQVTTITTKRDDAVDKTTTATTPYGMPDVKVVAMSALARVSVRAFRTYVNALTGLMGAGMSGLDGGMLPNDFGALLWASAGMAVAPMVMSILMNVSEMAMRLDESFPQLRG